MKYNTHVYLADANEPTLLDCFEIEKVYPAVDNGDYFKVYDEYGNLWECPWDDVEYDSVGNMTNYFVQCDKNGEEV